MRRRLWTMGTILIGLAACTFSALAAEPISDEAYIALFVEAYPKVEPAPTLAEYATIAGYDALYLGEPLEQAFKNPNNDSGGIAWGLAYRLMSLNDMYRATGEVRYLDAALPCMQRLLEVTDDKRGKALWTECVVAAWGCEKYAKRGRAVFAVHTGIIAAPMFEFVALARANATFKAAHADALDAVAEGAGLALAVHDRQWRDGPADDEGHYIGLDQEEVCENKPLPGNRLSAMGWALWASWQATGDTQHRDRAIAIGRYVKHRLTLAPDGAYYWPYWLAEERVTESAPRESIASEDASHAGLTMRLGFELAEDGQVFDDTDLARVGRTVRNGIGRLGGGILVSRVTGTTELKPSYIGYASAWLRVAKADPEAAQLIVDHYLNYRPAPGPRVLAELILYASKQP